MLDWVIRGGTVIDGSGGAPFRADIGICGGKIAAVGSCGEAAQTLDAAGRYVTPGFLDIHRHGDAAVFRNTMEVIREHYPRPAFYSALNILGTHDTPRILTLLGAEDVPDTKDGRAAYRLSPAQRQKGQARLRVGEMLLYCFPGSPTVYYGDEAGMEGFEDPLNRGTYPWGQEDQELLAFFRQLGQLRRERLSMQEGDLTYLHARGGVLVLRRQLGDEITVAALNAGEDAAEVAIPWPRELAREALTFQQFYAPGGKLRLRLPPVSGMILI